MTDSRPAPRFVDLDGPVHYVEHPGPDTAAPIVCVHGLNGSHANWHDLAPLLAGSRRVLALDLAGHGRTPRAGRSASVPANRALLARFLDEVVGEPAVLLGNSMGAAICMLQAAAAPQTVSGLVLLGPALPRARTDLPRPALARQVALCAVPRLGERALTRRRARLAPEQLVQETLRWTTADVSTVSLGMRQLAVELAAARAGEPDCDAAYLEAARSIGLLVARAARYRATIASIQVPAIVLQGALDRLVPAGGVRQLQTLQPGWDVHVLPGVGHVPQIEQPRRTAQLILDWLAQREPAAGGDPLLAGAS